MNDVEKLITIAQTYSYIRGKFTAAQLHDFLSSHNFKFHSSGITTRQIGRQLSKNSKFSKTDKNPTKYEAI